MYVVRVKDRGRDLATHQTERADEARELADPARVYRLIGYAEDKVLVESLPEANPKAA